MMVGLPQDPMGARLTQSLLDLFVLSQLDRGLQTPYDLLQQGGLSLGSTVPTLRRLGKAGLVRKKARPAGSSRRPRHCYELSAAGRKLARKGWIQLLKDRPPSDLDAVLRLADLAQHYGAKVADIASLFQRAARDRKVSSKQASSGRGKSGVAPLLYVATKNDWDACRLAAEARFLVGLAKSVMSEDTRNPKRGIEAAR
jgi:DNA-binding PadR family transcriptional regulator